MDPNLDDKRALITGSNTGLGEAIARLLAVEGATVEVLSFSGERPQNSS
jgi:NAD(P)-dependent dehydrogenase (short-subunit alcohol dehydrogenase family)